MHTSLTYVSSLADHIYFLHTGGSGPVFLPPPPLPSQEFLRNLNDFDGPQLDFCLFITLSPWIFLDFIDSPWIFASLSPFPLGFPIFNPPPGFSKFNNPLCEENKCNLPLCMIMESKLKALKCLSKLNPKFKEN